MCGRYTLIENLKDLEEWFDADRIELDELQPSYNVAPSQMVPVVGENEEGRRSILPFQWGFLPFWADEKDISYSMINARAETLDSKRSYKRNFKRYRCLVPASGFYEWSGEKGDKEPCYIYPTEEPVFAFAGIYNVWQSPDDDETIPTFTIVTTDANKKIKELHDRMPAILMKDEWEEWLDPLNDDTETLKELLQSFPDDALDFHQVSKKVNNVENNDKELIEPIE
ncbi:SOS response-associated peptidase [Rhodohalobacter sp. 8-1]|uniref:SOS response-associated peptidase n=1 Tax=Rhodohalobacter sp. 8-1 TaxID=3131972 RepID=UPI0030ED30DA